jgi:tRNA (guanine26-N2/guanine27-N2)-dimethyltransferase
VTATDTSALCGTYKEPCIRKYTAKPYKSEYCHENGIRILAGFVALTLSKYAKCIEVKMSHSTEHYMRLYLEIKKGSKRTDESLKNIGYISHCKNCLHRQTSNGLASPIEETCPVCGEKLVHAGPLWLGDIQNKEFIQKMIDETNYKKINSEKEALKLLNKCLLEAEAPVTFFDIHTICKSLKISAPKFDSIIEQMKEEGFIAIKTHYNPLGIKTDASIEDIKNILLKLTAKP